MYPLPNVVVESFPCSVITPVVVRGRLINASLISSRNQ